jgi:hypothetical protein
MFTSATQYDPHSLDEREEQRLRTLRRQMREQDERRYRDPDAGNILRHVYVVYQWIREQWTLVQFTRHEPTPKRLDRWRQRLKTDGVLRCVSLDVAWRFGPGAPPHLPPTSIRASRLHRANLTLVAQAAPEESVTRRVRAHASHGRCDYRIGKPDRCTRKAPWYVGYLSARTRTRIVKERCTRHAWDDRYLPDGVTQVIRAEIPR